MGKILNRTCACMLSSRSNLSTTTAKCLHLPVISIFSVGRVYKELCNDDLSTLETCQLLSEHEQSLKSAQDYKDCIQKLLQECLPLANYLQNNVVPWPADWPGWYFPKKNIALGKCEHLRQSVIPEQGQFHVSLNAAEDTVLIFKHFFDKLFKHVFVRDLPHKPKTYKITLCLTAALLGWLQIREKVLQKFGICKDHEYVSVIYLLEHVLPLVFFQYNIFRGGDVLEYENLMTQMAVLFICWERRHYNKSTLSFLSDLEYQKAFLPSYWSKKLKFLSLFTEKKVEIFHSLLRENSREHNDAKSLSETAKVLASCGFLSAFKESFVPHYHRGVSENNLWLMTGKTAEFLLDLFKQIASNSGKAHKVCCCTKFKQNLEKMSAKLICYYKATGYKAKILYPMIPIVDL